MIKAPTMMFTGVFGLDAFSEYRTRKRSHRLQGRCHLENTFAHDFSRHFLSRSVKLHGPVKYGKLLALIGAV